MKPLLKLFSQQIFPRHCLLCDFICDNQKLICNNCFETLPHYQFNKIESHSPINNIFSLFEYSEPISTLIWRLKFQGNLSIAQFFSQCWIEKMNSFYAQNLLPELIIPVPLYHARLKERGFNQALEIGKPIGKHFSIPIDTRTCIRIKNTQAQSSLPAKLRKNNMKNAFGLSYSIDAKHVAIVDDVVTTGNTVSEIAQLLRKVGVEKMDVWCCARVV